MSDVRPLPEEKAPAELKPIYETMKKKFGRMPNFFGMLANKPEVLKNFLPFYAREQAGEAGDQARDAGPEIQRAGLSEVILD